MEDLVLLVAGGGAPQDCLSVNQVTMGAYFRTRADFQYWPGVECYDEVQIVGR
jgi:hypothetical protein